MRRGCVFVFILHVRIFIRGDLSFIRTNQWAADCISFKMILLAIEFGRV